MSERYLAALSESHEVGEIVTYEALRLRLLNKYSAPADIEEQLHQRLGEIARLFAPLDMTVYDIAFVPRVAEVVDRPIDTSRRRSYLDPREYMRVRNIASPTVNNLHAKLYHAATGLGLAFDSRGMGLGGFRASYIADQSEVFKTGDKIVFPAFYELEYGAGGPEVVTGRFQFLG